ncbi:MAG: cobalamin-binding protein [Chitinophagaceae bacterium]|nr:MAG: cobalamin-binding protein [Chitinophagaceae bacterium]
MHIKVDHNEVFGFIRPFQDIHSLGMSTVGRLLEDCGFTVHQGDGEIAEAISRIAKAENISLLLNWINKNRITRLGFSYRLDPQDARVNFGRVFHLLKDYKAFSNQGGLLKQVYFAGLPEACNAIKNEYNQEIPVFYGDETQLETLLKIGIPEHKIPKEIYQGSKYDDDLMAFAEQFIASGQHHFFNPPKRETYPNFGTLKDTLAERVRYNKEAKNLPLTRVHVGPYNPKYNEAKKEFNSWLKNLSESGFLDIVSVGSSQLSQSNFGEEWGDKPNGGGVPINSEKDLRDIWEASRPMLVRTYAGTKNIPELAKIYEKNINIAWHALSLWWFNQIDGRGPYPVKKNLEQHFETLKVIAASGKPFEPNIPHHFSFRGGDDYSYVLSSYLAAIAAKKLGVKYMVLQVMLNTPKSTWGVQDLAKAKTLIKLLRELEDKNFKVFLQPRAGLDYFSPDLEKAKIQLAKVSAMMDDIEPDNVTSPDLIHVVSYCEAVKLATPPFINESIQITLSAIAEYRKQKKSGLVDDMKQNKEVIERTDDLYRTVKSIVGILEKNILDLYTPEGFYQVFKKGVMPVPYLWEGREEFKNAIKWDTRLVDGSVKVVDEKGKPVEPVKRVENLFKN